MKVYDAVSVAIRLCNIVVGLFSALYENFNKRRLG